MFDSLSGKLQQAFKNLRGLGKISEDNVAEPLREVRLALLDADVNFKVAKGFISRVKEQSLGEEVLASVQPGQMIVKIIHDELVALLGDTNARLETGGNPSCLMMVGLHGIMVMKNSLLKIHYSITLLILKGIQSYPIILAIQIQLIFHIVPVKNKFLLL